jgi:hypothetical protein
VILTRRWTKSPSLLLRVDKHYCHHILESPPSWFFALAGLVLIDNDGSQKLVAGAVSTGNDSEILSVHAASLPSQEHIQPAGKRF